MKLLVHIAAAMVAIPIAASGFSSKPETEVAMPHQIGSDVAVEICLDAATSAQDGPPVLALHSVAPTSDGWVAIEVMSLLTRENTVLGLFPSGAFQAASKAEARRFFLPPNAGNCFSLKIIGGGSATAEVTLERSAPLKP